MKRVLSVVVVLVGLVGCSSGSGSSPGPTVTVEHTEAGTVTVTRTVTAPAVATPTEASTSGAADTSATKTVKGQDGVARVTVTRPVPAKPAQYSTPPKEKVLYAVTVTFVGVSGKVDANPLFFQARDAQGDTFDAGLANIDNELSSGSVTPGRRLRGRIAFEVLKGKRISLITFGVIDELAAWQFPG